MYLFFNVINATNGDEYESHYEVRRWFVLMIPIGSLEFNIPYWLIIYLWLEPTFCVSQLCIHMYIYVY